MFAALLSLCKLFEVVNFRMKGVVLTLAFAFLAVSVFSEKAADKDKKEKEIRGPIIGIDLGTTYR